MAIQTKKISELTSTTTVASTDSLVLETTSGTRKITLANFEKINTDTTITVKSSGGDYSSVVDAFNALKDKKIGESTTVTISVDAGIFTHTSPANLLTKDANRVKIQGATTYTYNNVTAAASTGNSGNYTVVITNASNWTVQPVAGEYIIVKKLSVSTSAFAEGKEARHFGVWKVIDSTVNTVTIKNSCFGYTDGGTVSSFPSVDASKQGYYYRATTLIDNYYGTNDYLVTSRLLSFTKVSGVTNAITDTVLGSVNATVDATASLTNFAAIPACTISEIVHVRSVLKFTGLVHGLQLPYGLLELKDIVIEGDAIALSGTDLVVSDDASECVGLHIGGKDATTSSVGDENRGAYRSLNISGIVGISGFHIGLQSWYGRINSEPRMLFTSCNRTDGMNLHYTYADVPCVVSTGNRSHGISLTTHSYSYVASGVFSGNFSMGVAAGNHSYFGANCDTRYSDSTILGTNDAIDWGAKELNSMTTYGNALFVCNGADGLNFSDYCVAYCLGAIISANLGYGAGIYSYSVGIIIPYKSDGSGIITARPLETGGLTYANICNNRGMGVMANCSKLALHCSHISNSGQDGLRLEHNSYGETSYMIIRYSCQSGIVCSQGSRTIVSSNLINFNGIYGVLAEYNSYIHSDAASIVSCVGNNSSLYFAYSSANAAEIVAKDGCDIRMTGSYQKIYKDFGPSPSTFIYTTQNDNVWISGAALGGTVTPLTLTCSTNCCIDMGSLTTALGTTADFDLYCYRNGYIYYPGDVSGYDFNNITTSTVFEAGWISTAAS